MELPDDTTLPMFSYGLFKPGQLGYFRIEDTVEETITAKAEGKLYERDGVPVLVEHGTGQVSGEILEFASKDAESGYESIVEIEPEKQYRWAERDIYTDGESCRANILLGRNPTRGTAEIQTNDWDGSNDPIFSDALEVVEEIINSDAKFDRENKKPFFQLQMAYLLLWSSIERYISLRYGLRGFGGDISIRDKLKQMAKEPGFEKGLKNCELEDHQRQRIVRADRPEGDECLDPEDPVGSIDYYYQIRSNLSHRGKSAPVDFNTLQCSLEQLYRIFRFDVLEDAFNREK